MILTLRGRKYLIRGNHTAASIEKLFKSYVIKFGETDFHRWLVERGKVYKEVRKRNSGTTEYEEAVSAAEGAHGRKAKESVHIKERLRFRESLAMMGELEELEVFNEFLYDGDLEQLVFKRGARSLVRLGFSSDRRQLFLVGGDQKLEDEALREFSPSGWNKDKVLIGYVYSITYHTDKHHLEGSSGKIEPYMHCFGEQSFKNPNAPKDGSADYMVWKLEEKLVAGVLPEIVYDRLNEQLEFVGGGYKVKDEGIFD